ncbi:MAG: hypothetical protein M3Q99_14955 [Acidobacteriota bacterium]|nr:hypothetical protein [Acidobacteriota bacterium]
MCFYLGSNVWLLQFLSAYLGISIPYIDWIIFKAVEFAIFVPIVGLILYPVNERVRFWRKKRGRDIEAEEKYETDSGIIKLTPND